MPGAASNGRSTYQQQSRLRITAATMLPSLLLARGVQVTLLLCNACAMEALPLFLDTLTDPATAILVSVTAVLVFGEVLPQAVCSRWEGTPQTQRLRCWCEQQLITVQPAAQLPSVRSKCGEAARLDAAAVTLLRQSGGSSWQ